MTGQDQPRRRPAPRPLGLSPGALIATAAAGVLLVAFAVGLAGSPVAIAGALLAALVLAAAALAVSRRQRRATRPRRATIKSMTTPPAQPARHGTPEPVAPPLASGGATEGVAHDLALEAVRQLHAPAAAVLVPRGRRLVSAASAGDWALARRIQHEHDTAGAPPGSRPLSAAPAEGTEGAPPEFPLDDFLPRLLGLYSRAVPFERWHELSDVPPALLPLAALADRGAAVAVALRHRRRLAGLWLLARRPGDQAYSDAELGTLEQMARQAGPALAKTLSRDA